MNTNLTTEPRVLTPELATEIARLVNSCTVWATAARDSIAESLNKSGPECVAVLEQAQARMRWHDESAIELNNLLGTSAVTLFHGE